MRVREDVLFARYCRDGDVEALTQLFDRTSGRLRRAAMRLTKSHDYAEDLVQSTFLRAIEKSHVYNPEQPVFPWLLGIMTNFARHLRREQKRELETERVEQPRAKPPEESASDGEFHRVLDESILQLPSSHRLVVQLYLRRGLGPREIARNLGRSASTVRIHLVRGLEQLRQLLPASFAGSLVVVLASRKATASTAGGALAWATGRRAVGLLAASAAGLALWTGTGAGEDRPLDSGPPAAAIASVLAPATPPVVTPPAPLVRSTAAPVGSPRAATIAGQCVAAENGGPIAGCRVRLTAVGPIGAGAPGPERVPFVEVDAISDENGRFELQVEPSSQFERYELTAVDGARGRVQARRSWSKLRAGATIDAGSMRLAEGALIAGRVVDGRGQPIRDAKLRIGDSVEVATDHRGRYELASALPSGVWPIEVRADDVQRWSPARVVAKPGLHDFKFDIIVAKRLSIRGEVVDERGRPVAGMVVLDSAGSGRHAFTRTDGSFALFAGSDAASTARLRALHWRYRPIEVRRAVPWGTRGLRLVARSSAHVDLTVVDAVTGEPVRDYAVRCAPATTVRGRVVEAIDKVPFIAPLGVRHHGPHPDGRLRVRHLWDGANILWILPDDPRYAALGPIFVEVESGVAEPIHVAVHTSTAIDLELCYADPLLARRAVSGSHVQLIEVPAPFGIGLADEVIDPIALGLADRWRGPRLLSEGVTDSQGQVRLFTPVLEDLVLRVLGPGHAPGIVPLDYRPGAGRVLIAVQVDARLRGFFEDPAHAAFMQTVRLVRTDAAEDWQQVDLELRVAADGSFECAGLAAGRYAVLPCASPAAIAFAESPQRAPVIGPPLAELALAPGTWTALDCDPNRYRPGTLHGRLFGNQDFVTAGVWLVGTRDGVAWRLGPYSVEGAGSFVCEDIPPGDYQLEFVDDVQRGRQSLVTPRLVGSPFAVPAGQVVEQIFDVE